jgi:choline-sulfatase
MIRRHFTDDQWRHFLWTYHRLVEDVDRQIGIIIEALVDTGKFDDTIIVLTSDHGEMAGSHRSDQKEFLFEECCRVPLVIKGVTQKGTGNQSRTNESLTINGLDCYPTILDYAGIDLPDYLTGYSLKDCVDDGAKLERKVVVVECQGGVMALDGQYKYAFYVEGKNAEQFYDLGINPGEMYNQLNDTRYNDEINRLRDVVQKHISARPGIWN